MVRAVMPLRSGSKRIPGKNMRPFHGVPLFYWNLAVLHESQMCDDIVISTDSSEYERLLAGFAQDIEVFYRSKETASDEAVTIDVVREMLEAMDWDDDDVFLLSQATSPYLRFEDIVDVVSYTAQGHSAMTAGRIKRFLWSEDGLGLNHNPHIQMRSQDWSGTLIQNGCLYGARIGDIKREGILWPGAIHFVEQPHWFELDEEPDWAYGEAAIELA